MTHHRVLRPSGCTGRGCCFRLWPPFCSWCSPSTSPAAPQRRYLCTVHRSPPRSYLLAWGLLFLVWMAVDWLTRFAPLATLLSACWAVCPHGGLLHPAAPGRALPPWDLMQVSEAAGVASAAGIHVQKSMVVSGVVVLALTVGSFFLYRGVRSCLGAASGGLCGQHSGYLRLIFGVFLQPAVTQSLGILPDAWMQDRYYRYYGVITSFLTNLTNLEIDKPEDYSEEAINAILDDVEAGEKYTTSPAWPDSYAAQTPADEQVKQPTILYVMDESYWDVSELEQYGFRFDTDVSANLHALQQTSAYGRVYSPSFGGGTCDVEFEALTGYSVSYLPSGSKPYQQHVTRPMFALPSYLKTEGYQTAAVHCFWARYWSVTRPTPTSASTTSSASRRCRASRRCAATTGPPASSPTTPWPTRSSASTRP